jgi:adenosine deaminase CECR1
MFEFLFGKKVAKKSVKYPKGLLKMAKKYKVKLPFFFHDGESNWNSSDGVIDAVLLGSKRIGHGFNIALKPGILNVAKKNDICLEICPISNQMLQYVPDIRVHFANTLFKNGCPMVISTDYPLMFGYTGLTYDFFAVVTSWQLDLKSIKTLVFNSIIYSSLNDGEKQTALQNLRASWDDWIYENRQPIITPTPL